MFSPLEASFEALASLILLSGKEFCYRKFSFLVG